ncbi:MAG: thioredoxin domain-containing protein [Rickettsia endosymbiont of Argas persicus]
MRIAFITLISLLFLSNCSEEKTRDKEQIVEQETAQNNEEPINDNSMPSQEENVQNTSESIAPDNNINPASEEEVTPATQQIELKPESKPIRVTFMVEDTDMVLGNKESNVVVVEYFSPTCPHCAYFHSTIFPEIKKKYIDTNKIAYITREFIATKQDLDASILARCRGDINSFIQLHEIILKQQDKWAYSNKYRELLTNIGQLSGISPEEYKKCLSNDKISETLIANTNFVSKAPKFIGTPSFFVNGVQTENYSINSISSAIDEAIEKAKNKVDL